MVTLSRSNATELTAMLEHLTLEQEEPTPTLVERVIMGQPSDPLLTRYRDCIEEYGPKGYHIDEKGALRLGNQLCVPGDQAVRQEIIPEAHQTRLTIHLGASKMYQELCRWYTWLRIKIDVVGFVGRCLTCQQVKA
ncbi:PREDICTED: uncharacterized protein LOC104816647 [Tarenaya hassleriana]|uniref:uncharacterized protein LOC104816647 n=1 Tax=Tarenaya hassleriana TaxID=28532 RepID=UPI00053C35A2|nr:PREDICTED: uncharacterized protein LOC104816647 [Tarenaya hassleriana]